MQVFKDSLTIAFFSHRTFEWVVESAVYRMCVCVCTYQRPTIVSIFVIVKSWSQGNEAWSISSVRASGTEVSEFEPFFCHSFLCGGLWQDLVIPCVWDTTVIAGRWGEQSHVSEWAKMRLFCYQGWSMWQFPCLKSQRDRTYLVGSWVPLKEVICPSLKLDSILSIFLSQNDKYWWNEVLTKVSSLEKLLSSVSGLCVPCLGAIYVLRGGSQVVVKYTIIG